MPRSSVASGRFTITHRVSGEKIPRKAARHHPIDLLVINKTDLAPLIGADLDVMARDSKTMRGDGPFLFTQVTNDIGVREIAAQLIATWKQAAGRE